MQSFKKFLAVPSNRIGLSAWFATLLTVVLQYWFLDQIPPVDDALGLLLGAVAIIQPDNTVTKKQLEVAIADLKSFIASPAVSTEQNIAADVAGIASNIITGKSS